MFHISRRRKVLVVGAKEGSWFEDLNGKALWVNRKSIHKNDEGVRVYNLHFNYTDLEIPVRNTIWIPKYIRKFFHTVNSRLEDFLPVEPIIDTENY